MVDRKALAEFQNDNDALMASQTLKEAFDTDITAVLQMSRYKAGGAIDPITCYRAAHYREKLTKDRPASKNSGSGIVLW